MAQRDRGVQRRTGALSRGAAVGLGLWLTAVAGLGAGCRSAPADGPPAERRAAAQTAAGARPPVAQPATAASASDGDGGGGAERRFVTAPAMYSANEEWLTFACELPDGQVFIGSRKAVEMYWYSRYGLGNLLFRSGMGVHIVHNPLFKEHVAHDEGMPWYGRPDGARRFLQHKLAQFVKRTAADRAAHPFPPKGAYPIYLEFASGVPEFLQPPDLDDFRTLRWDPARMDRSMTPAGWGQTLLKQVLWARDFFTDPKEIDGVVYLGNAKDDGGNGFRGAVLTAQAITKSYALLKTLAYHAAERRLGAVDPKTYNPAAGAIYYPHRYEVRFAPDTPAGMPPAPSGFVVTDPRSDLFDVASLLWGESEFYFFTDPTVADDYDAVFGDPKWNPHAPPEKLRAAFRAGKALFPRTPHKLARGLVAVQLKNLKALHFDPQHHTLVDTWQPGHGRGSHVQTRSAALAMVALANTYHRVHDVKPLRALAARLLFDEAQFLLAHQGADGGFADGYRLGASVQPDPGPRTLAAQAFAIRGLLAAYHVREQPALLEAAERAYDFMERKLYAPQAGVYRSQEGAARSRYDGYSFGATLGALRELAIVRHGAERRQVVGRLDRFFERVAQRAGLQLAELGATGEPVPPLAVRRQKMQQLQALAQRDPDAARRMRAKIADADRDGVPKPPFVPGTRFGAAPVQTASVTIATP